jgi:hypothetical protein
VDISLERMLDAVHDINAGSVSLADCGAEPSTESPNLRLAEQRP